MMLSLHSVNANYSETIAPGNGDMGKLTSGK